MRVSTGKGFGISGLFRRQRSIFFPSTIFRVSSLKAWRASNPLPRRKVCSYFSRIAFRRLFMSIFFFLAPQNVNQMDWTSFVPSGRHSYQEHITSRLNILFFWISLYPDGFLTSAQQWLRLWDLVIADSLFSEEQDAAMTWFVSLPPDKVSPLSPTHPPHARDFNNIILCFNSTSLICRSPFYFRRGWQHLMSLVSLPSATEWCTTSLPTKIGNPRRFFWFAHFLHL